MVVAATAVVRLDIWHGTALHPMLARQLLEVEVVSVEDTMVYRTTVPPLVTNAEVPTTTQEIVKRRR